MRGDQLGVVQSKAEPCRNEPCFLLSYIQYFCRGDEGLAVEVDATITLRLRGPLGTLLRLASAYEYARVP